MVDVRRALVKVGSKANNPLPYNFYLIIIIGDMSDATHGIDDRSLVNQFDSGLLISPYTLRL